MKVTACLDCSREAEGEHQRCPYCGSKNVKTYIKGGSKRN